MPSLPKVAVVNETSVLSATDSWRLTWALQYQLYYQWYPAWQQWAHVSELAKGQPIPAETSILHLIDNSDTPGALGYHDEEGNEVPFARVFCKTAKENGLQPSEVASHELLELLNDPHVNLTAPDGALSRLYAYEMCDACQSNGYEVGTPGKGLIVADFNLPAYFDPKTEATAKTSYTGALKGPFALGPKGYYSYIDLSNVSAGWQQKVGSEYVGKPTDLDERHERRKRVFGPHGLTT